LPCRLSPHFSPRLSPQSSSSRRTRRTESPTVIARSSCDEAIQLLLVASGLLRFARNDSVEPISRNIETMN
jgi:hypothetical protein